MKLFIAVVAGAVLGMAGSRYLFVGSWLSLIPWGVIGLALGFWEKNGRAALLNGAFYGFALAFVFMLAGYGGSAPVLSRLPFFAILGVVGAICGLALGFFGSWLRRMTVR